MFKVGDIVKLSNMAKIAFRGECGELGYHTYDIVIDGDCYGCSSAHVDEFQYCIGEVIGLDEWDVEVKWLPSNLRYKYLVSHLELANKKLLPFI